MAIRPNPVTNPPEPCAGRLHETIATGRLPPYSHGTIAIVPYGLPPALRGTIAIVPYIKF